MSHSDQAMDSGDAITMGAGQDDTVLIAITMWGPEGFTYAMAQMTQDELRQHISMCQVYVRS